MSFPLTTFGIPQTYIIASILHNMKCCLYVSCG